MYTYMKGSDRERERQFMHVHVCVYICIYLYITRRLDFGRGGHDREARSFRGSAPLLLTVPYAYITVTIYVCIIYKYVQRTMTYR